MADGQGSPPAEQHFLVPPNRATEPRNSHVLHRRALAPGSAVAVASGDFRRSRACAISSAVRNAVPEGASTLSGWCISTISTDSKNGAATAAKRIMSTAPMGNWEPPERPCPDPVSSFDLLKTLAVEAAGPDDDMDPTQDAVFDRAHHHIGRGEVDDHITVVE